MDEPRDEISQSFIYDSSGQMPMTYDSASYPTNPQMNETRDEINQSYVYDRTGQMPMIYDSASYPTNPTYGTDPDADEPIIVLRDDKSAIDEQRLKRSLSADGDEQTVITVPTALLPEIRRLLAFHKTAQILRGN